MTEPNRDEPTPHDQLLTRPSAEPLPTPLDPAGPEDRVSASDVYDLYSRWHIKQRGKYVPTMHTFGRHLGRKVQKQKVGGTVYYYGVKLNTIAQDNYPKKTSGKGGGNEFANW